MLQAHSKSSASNPSLTGKFTIGGETQTDNVASNISDGSNFVHTELQSQLELCTLFISHSQQGTNQDCICSYIPRV